MTPSSRRRPNTLLVMNPHPLIEKWRRESDLFERRGLSNLAAMARSFADDLAAYEIEHGLEALTLTQASAESGYSAAHLSRAIAEERIENVGDSGRPRIRRKDLPRKIAPAPDNGPDLVGAVRKAQSRRTPETL